MHCYEVLSTNSIQSECDRISHMLEYFADKGRFNLAYRADVLSAIVEWKNLNVGKGVECLTQLRDNIFEASIRTMQVAVQHEILTEIYNNCFTRWVDY